MADTARRTIGRYEVQRPLGSGGMGVLYLARDPVIDRLVALKLMREGEFAVSRERFIREARSAGRLHHPNIVTIFDVGEHDGQPFIAMQYVGGQTLASLIEQRTPVAFFRKLHWMEELCAGLHYAHRADIIHRDIKPANVMIDEQETIKILDFGIARLGPSSLTQGMVGTLNFMAPEQLEGLPVDHRADIFSLGALFYELLSYRRAFPGAVDEGVLTKILNGEPDPLDDLAPDVDPAIVHVVQRCLSKRREDRYPDCLTIAREIASVRVRLTQRDTAGTPPALVLDVQSEPAHPEPPMLDSGEVETTGLAASPESTLALDMPAQEAPEVVQETILAEDTVRDVPAREKTAAFDAPALRGSTVVIDSGAHVQAQPETRKSRTWLIASVLAAVLAGGFLAYSYRSGTSEPGNSQTTASGQQTAPSNIDTGGAIGAAGATATGGGADSGRTEPGPPELPVTRNETSSSEVTRPPSSALVRATTPASSGDPRGRGAAPPQVNDGSADRGGVTTSGGPPTSDPPLPESARPSDPQPRTVVETDLAPGTLPGRVEVPSAPAVAVNPAPAVNEDPAAMRAADEREIRAVLGEYEAAYERLDASAVRRVYPSLSSAQGQQLATDFGQYNAYAMQFENMVVTVAGSTATVRVRTTRTISPKVGRPQTTSATVTFDLQKTGSTWVISRLAQSSAR